MIIMKHLSSLQILLLSVPVQLTHSFSPSTSTLTTRSKSMSMSMSTSTSTTATSSKIPKNILVIGGGIQGTSVAYHLSQHPSYNSQNTKIQILEAKSPASAASGKGGGFMARSWGDGSPTQSLHHLGFDLYKEYATKLDLKSYRKLPVLSVSPGKNDSGLKRALKDRNVKDVMPNWLDGNMGNVGLLGYGDDTAQVTPTEIVERMIEMGNIEVIVGECVGVESNINEVGSGNGDDDGNKNKQISGVRYIPRGQSEEVIIEADTVVVSAGPWSCTAEDWFDNAVDLPMEGVKSTSIVWKKGEDDVDATALFCGEDNRFGTHLEVYPRPDGSIYICGIGGSDYITKEELKAGAYREECNAKESRVDAASSAFREMSGVYKQKGALDRVQACMRPCPPDAMPYMGKIPGYDGAYINAGHNCWGIAWAASCGKAMAELIWDGESSSVDLKPFDPSRFTTKVGGGRGRKRRGMNVGEQW
mmetsp:Transcript_28983/g.33310  ORF Transcript_28983/g.33310 Transcript_28983/m.33310 type:complete len:474 (+) Transcript_28983:75-1496(+)